MRSQSSKKYPPLYQRVLAVTIAGLMALPTAPVWASSHMDAPLIVRDPAANTTDVYAFVQVENGVKTLITALGVYPHQEPGIGPNKYNFDDSVLYEIHVALGDDVAAGRASVSYQFQFETRYQNAGTILQSYVGVITNIADAAQNIVQTYTVTKVQHPGKGRGQREKRTVLGSGIVPPNNQGYATPFYNQNNDGGSPARDGVATEAELDRYTTQAISSLTNGYIAFAGQRDDGFYADIQSIFDLLSLRNPGRDSQGGFNIHLMSLAIPVADLGGDQQVVGVYATTSRKQVKVLRDAGDKEAGRWVQVARQGNPLFNEGLVALADKDLYSRTDPSTDGKLFRKYAEKPELAGLINALLLGGSAPGITTGRTDIASIYIPDLIKVDLSTGPCRLAGGGPNHPTNPDDTGFSRLSVFGGDVLTSTVQAGLPGFPTGTIPGGWPNGRRFGDDVVDIAVDALISDLRVVPLVVNTFPPGDGVSTNDMAYNKVFPYEATPHNGRAHQHP